MAYSREKQRIYLLALVKRRRDAWIKENGPCRKCGSWEDLEVDHVDPATKSPRFRGNASSNVWHWPQVERNAELAKCQPLCGKCHKEKTATEAAEQALRGNFSEHGNPNAYYHGCRCSACREAYRLYRYAFYDAHGGRSEYRKLHGG